MPVGRFGSTDSTDARAAIAAADTLFVASGHPEAPGADGGASAVGMDASHRGGAPGFVEVVDESRLTLPDYAGNRLFNTLGNLELDPRIGLLFVDFARGDLLQLTGRVRTEWHPPPSARHPGAQRLVHIRIEALVRRERAQRWRWRSAAGARRELVVATRETAGADAASLELAARDGEPLAPFSAGQYVSLEPVSGKARGLGRTYSLSGNPARSTYRVTVRYEPDGQVSRALHGLRPGEIVLAGSPAGEFALPPGDGMVALAGAGIGLTPIVAMAHALARVGRETRVLAVARDGAHAPLIGELVGLARRHQHMKLHRVSTRPRRDDRSGIDFDANGRPDAATVAVWLDGVGRTGTGTLDIDVCLCGSPGFVDAVTKLLEAAGAEAERIGVESF